MPKKPAGDVPGIFSDAGDQRRTLTIRYWCRAVSSPIGSGAPVLRSKPSPEELKGQLDQLAAAGPAM